MNISESKAVGVATVIPLPPRQLPFETWRPIFQIVYATETSISHPPSDFEISSLNSRLHVYRCLALVSRSWRANARDVFFEELQALTADALKGLIKTFQNDRHLALAVSRISFSFGEFRCTASTPRRPRPLRPDPEPDAEAAAPANEHGGASSSSLTRRIPDWKSIHRKDAVRYQPSTTAQGSHWTRWQADVGHILTMCTSLSEVKIISTYHMNTTFYQPRSRNYRAWFPPPDLTNENILNGLLHSENLRSLRLVDPTPLEKYGPILTSWERLKDLSIVLTRPFQELENTAFIPPKSLVSFRFHDRSTGRKQIPWPLASDLARCTNLQVLDLGVTSLTSAETTAKAIGFLCSAYQHSLRELTLHMFHGGSGTLGFQDVLESVSPLHFPNLQRFRLPEANYSTSLFSCFRADELKYVEVGWLEFEPGTGSREDKWSRGLSHSSLRALKHLVINKDDLDDRRKQALEVVCERSGITLIMGRLFSDPDFPEEEEGEHSAFEVVNV